MAVRETGPQPSLESEMAVLGSLLIDPDIVRPLLAEVREEDFQSPVNREIFQTARALFRAGKPVDAITIRESLKTDYTDYLVQLMEITPTSANWREYAAILRDKATLNRAAVLGGELSVAQDLDTCRDLIAKLGQLFSGGRKLAAWTMPELLESFFQSQEPDQPPVEYISFGLDVVDKGSYIQRGDVVVLGGYPSDGNRRSDYPKKLVSAGLANFNHVDFAHFSFGTNRKPKVKRVKLKVKKATFYKLIFESKSASATVTVLETDIQLRYAGNVK